ncbi:MAG: hypothetical protein Q7T55_26730 [Solirubrobacteraceae bacterium]|nr:hypothetical protein [Solirubrobacteraceae bacterium]
MISRRLRGIEGRQQRIRTQLACTTSALQREEATLEYNALATHRAELLARLAILGDPRRI